MEAVKAGCAISRSKGHGRHLSYFGLAAGIVLSVSWGTVISLTPEWRMIEVPIERFRYFSQWGMVKPKDLELDLGKVSAINFCIGRWLLGDNIDSERGFEVSSVRPVFGELGRHSHPAEEHFCETIQGKE